MARFQVFGVAVVLAAAACAHDSEGHRLRTSTVRFDERSVSGMGFSYTLEEDGTWAGTGGDRYARVGDEIKRVGGFDQQPALIRASGSIEIVRRPDGVQYVPSYPGGRIWTFVTADGQPIPQNLEIPLYLVAQVGLTGTWITLHNPGSEKAGIPLQPDCQTVFFDLGQRKVAGWVALQGTACPEPSYPGPDGLARVVAERNEIWESQLRPQP
jgi:hypothetical protein